MSKLATIEEKWFRKTNAAQRKWLNAVKSSESLDAFCKQMASALGISEGEVRASLPVKNWAEFQANAEKYLPLFIDGVKKAYDNKKWSKGMIDAFTTPA